MNFKITGGGWFYGALIVALSAWILQSFLSPFAGGVCDCNRELAALQTVRGPLAPAHAAKRDFSDLHFRDECVRAGTIDVCRGRTARRSPRTTPPDRRRRQ